MAVKKHHASVLCALCAVRDAAHLDQLAASHQDLQSVL